MYSENRRHRRQISLAFTITLKSGLEHFLKSMLVLSLVIINLPVLHGCVSSMPDKDSAFTAGGDSAVRVAVHYDTPPAKNGATDVLVFTDDALGRIECYQRFEEGTEDGLMIGSQAGGKRVFICVNSHWGKDCWRGLRSMSGLEGLKADLEEESPGMPLMTGTGEIMAGHPVTVCVERLCSEVILNSLAFDFSGRPYAGEKVSDVRIYLTNVNATSSIMAGAECMPERIVNQGGLRDVDMKEFPYPEMLLQTISGPVGTDRIYPRTRFLCYGNTCSEEGPGTPFTRLVIEGRISGETWYWPIDINRRSGSGHEGIRRNTSYTFDITVRRKGSKDPDRPVEIGTSEIQMEVGQWKEKDGYSVGF